MSVLLSRNGPARLRGDAGIAIGPILFIIAILGILATAIAAGSGSFQTSTTAESNSTKAAALIEIGQILKVGVDRLMSNGIDLGTMTIDPTKTSATIDLFSPTGGGISVPSTTMAAAPATDGWNYPLVRIPNVGTASGSRLAVIPVTTGVCDQINIKANGAAVALGAGAALGDFGANGAVIDDAATWPAALAGKSIGCVRNTTAATAGAATATLGTGYVAAASSYYYYQIIGIQ